MLSIWKIILIYINTFINWWTKHKKQPPIPPGFVIPINLESPRLWEKHADAILQDIGLTPRTIHEPCLYFGLINNTRVVLMRQVNNFAIASIHTQHPMGPRYYHKKQPLQHISITMDVLLWAMHRNRQHVQVQGTPTYNISTLWMDQTWPHPTLTNWYIY